MSSDQVVLFDEGHFSNHSARGTYAPFTRIAEGAGWAVRSITRLDEDTLNQGQILVIVNALHRSSVNNWSLPTPSALTPAETSAVRAWVEAGHGLLLIADHMPFPGGAESLASVFRVRFSNGFAFDTTQLDQPQSCLTEDQVHVFRAIDGALGTHPTTAGVSAIATFTGSAFRSDGEPLMTFGPTAVSLEPTIAWEFDATTPSRSVAGWQQGAALAFGEGRVVVLGEAAMFTEQVCGVGQPMGMQSPVATGNRQFALNVIQWLGQRARQ